MKFVLSIIFVCSALGVAFGQEKSVVLEDPFDNLSVSGNIHLQLIASDNQQLTILSTENPDDLDMETRKGQLILKTKSELSNSPVTKLNLHFVSLSGLEVTRGGRVQSGDTLNTEILHLEVQTGGKVELIVGVDSISAKVNQGADIILYGNTRSQFVNAYTWGNYLAYELESRTSYVKAATGAQVKLNASQLLQANATSKAFIGYQGEPEKKNLKTSVGGEITQLSE